MPSFEARSRFAEEEICNMRFLRTITLAVAFLVGTSFAFASQTISTKSRVIQKVNVQLTGYTQGPFSSRGDVDGSLVKKTHIDSKDLLRLMAAATSDDFFNSELVVTNSEISKVLVLRGTRVLADVSTFFIVEDFTDGGVRRETLDTYTGKAHYKKLRVLRFAFGDGAGNDFDLTGFTTETVSGSRVDDKGNQTLSRRITMKVNGAGHINGVDAIFKGTIIIGGSGTVKHQ
jgi:hypothetical protein